MCVTKLTIGHFKYDQQSIYRITLFITSFLQLNNCLSDFSWRNCSRNIFTIRWSACWSSLSRFGAFGTIFLLILSAGGFKACWALCGWKLHWRTSKEEKAHRPHTLSLCVRFYSFFLSFITSLSSRHTLSGTHAVQVGCVWFISLHFLHGSFP